MDWATSSLPNTYMEGSTIASDTRGVPYTRQVRVLPVLALNEVSSNHRRRLSASYGGSAVRV